MNHLEACKRARELWGACGSVESRNSSEPMHRRCVVGTIGALPGKSRIGYGATWEEAFADAEKEDDL